MNPAYPDHPRSIHIIGIGGIGTSGLALIFKSEGVAVSGSDSAWSPLLTKLKRKGVRVYKGQNARAVKPGTDLVVFSQAVTAENPEYRRALALGIPLRSYPEALGVLMRGRRGIAIAGTHGKTTTSALMVSVLTKCGRSPSFVIGGEIVGSSNSGVGRSDLFVIESCEYKRSFLNYKPEIAVITNIEEDHLDYYRDIGEIREAFSAFAARVKPGGLLVFCADDANAAMVAKTSSCRTVSYGTKNGLWTADRIGYAGGMMSFRCLWRGSPEGSLSIRLNGRHNILNALAVTAAARELGISRESLSRAMPLFRGVRRRCEFKGCRRGVTVLDDYGHHPTEIRATLCSLRERYPDNRLIVVFQPHQYSRTRFLLKDFASSFSRCDKIVVPDIYFVRDSDQEKKMVNADILVQKIRANGKDALYLPGFGEIAEYLAGVAREGDVVVTMGAGPVNRVGESLLRRLNTDKKQKRV